MAKKAKVEVEEDNFGEVPGEEIDLGEGLGDLDFNVDDEYKPDPLIGKGTFHGVVTNVKFVPTQSCILWDICLHDNGGAMNDGVTPIDGAHVWFRNWLPKPGDENELTKSGKNNKRQSKINMLGDFAQELDINMSTPTKIATSIAEAEWVGLEVSVDVDVDEYQGKFRNTVNRMKKSLMY